MLYASWRDFDGDWRWKNFTPRELSCQCGGRFCAGSYWHDPGFLDAAQAVRDETGSLKVTSAHRDPIWNARVGGAPRSQHKTIAVDLGLAGHDHFALLDAAIRHGFTGIGLARSFIHLDRRVRPARWDYGPLSRKFWKLEK
jgi:hypothetical protein